MSAKPTAVHVRWRDSATHTKWQSYEGRDVMVIESVGWLLEETKDKVVIASSYDDQGERQWADIMVIPRECVVSKKVVKYG